MDTACISAEPGGRATARVAHEIEHALGGRDGVALVSGIPHEDGNGPLIDMARSLGTLLVAGTQIPGHPLEDGVVYRVEVRNGGEGVLDEDRLVMFSTTSERFNCHTDGYHREEPPDYVAMLCVRADAEGGDSLVVHVDALVSRLSPAERELLREPVFPTTFGSAAVLTGTDEQPQIRFNLREIARFSEQADERLTDAHVAAARRLDELAAEECERRKLRLAPGDCLILDNKRVLHGRTELAGESRRLLKRLWIRAEPSEGRRET